MPKIVYPGPSQTIGSETVHRMVMRPLCFGTSFGEATADVGERIRSRLPCCCEDFCGLDAATCPPWVIGW